ncbi:MAG: [FeFe] hydrogenase H-cluster radical SAM maturase HydE [Ruminococcus sp.]
MKLNVRELIEKLYESHSLKTYEYEALLKDITEEDREYLKKLARQTCEEHYGTDVYIRGLIEVSNICKNDCYYCGIRASNKACDRYRLTDDEILACCDEGYALGFRTFVMQGGEDFAFSDDRLCALVSKIKDKFPDCAITLSLGERTKESYEKLKKAGADRYLLRHETADREHYKMLHPENLSWDNRMECLRNLRASGYQVGCGFMVGSPFQTVGMLAKDLKFIEEFKPDMCGIGPFIPHKETAFRDCAPGDVKLTLTLLSLVRLIHPKVLLPATTALGTLQNDGREEGILSGANVIMPNLSPKSVRKKYMLYDNKLSDGDESAEAVNNLRARIEAIGCRVVTARGDVKK